MRWKSVLTWLVVFLMGLVCGGILAAVFLLMNPFGHGEVIEPQSSQEELSEAVGWVRGYEEGVHNTLLLQEKNK